MRLLLGAKLLTILVAHTHTHTPTSPYSRPPELRITDGIGVCFSRGKQLSTSRSLLESSGLIHLKKVFGQHKSHPLIFFTCTLGCLMQPCTHVGRRWKWARPPSALCVLISGWCTAEYWERGREWVSEWTERSGNEETQREPPNTQTHTCPELGSHHWSVNPSTCPKTQHQWAVCTDQTLLQSCQATEKKHNEIYNFTRWSKHVFLSLLCFCLPLLEEHVVCETCQNWGQKTRVLQKLLGTKPQQKLCHPSYWIPVQSQHRDYSTSVEKQDKKNNKKQRWLTVCSSRG